jgi:hypothetical protein
MQFYWLILGGLATWRLTHLFNAEDGPWDLVFHLRRAVGNGFWGKLLDCFHCLSLWFAAPIALLIGQSALERIVLWLALSAFAMLLESTTTEKHTSQPPPVHYVEDEDPQE